MKYGSKFKTDIAKLKKIVDPAKHKEHAEKLAELHGVAVSTIYRHEGKKVPGKRKVRADRGIEKSKPTAKELEIFRELLTAGKTMQEAMQIFEKETGKKVSTRYADKASKKIKAADKPVEKTKFGGNIKEFLQKYFKLEYVAPGAVINIKLDKFKVDLERADINDIVRILANAYNRSEFNKGKIKLDRDQLTRNMVKALFQEHLEIAKDTGSLKDFTELTNIQKKLENTYKNLSPNFKILESILREFNPELTFDDVYNLVEKHSTEQQ